MQLQNETGHSASIPRPKSSTDFYRKLEPAYTFRLNIVYMYRGGKENGMESLSTDKERLARQLHPKMKLALSK